MLRGNHVQPAWRALRVAALGAATAAERAALGGAAAPPEGSRAQFWAALAALGRERAAAVFEAHPAHCAELLALSLIHI